MNQHPIHLHHVNVHNLKEISLTLNPGELIVFSGVSGSGKSSMAFDTLYVEGQRRYVESLSTYARRQLGELAKPDMESASGITPTISIEQKSASKNPRSTVGTLTEIYDYLRVLYARVSIPYCPISHERLKPQSKEAIIHSIQAGKKGQKILLLAPLAKGRKGEFKDEFSELLKKGYSRVRVDGKIVRLDEEISLDKSLAHDVEVVIDRIVLNDENMTRLAESITSALSLGKGVLIFTDEETGEETLFSEHAYSEKSGLSYEALEPQDFSFNSPKGYCPRCLGLGIVEEFDLEKVIDPNKSIKEDCCSVASSYATVRFGNIYENLSRLYHFSLSAPWKKLPEEAKKVFLYGTEKKWTRMHFQHPVTGKTWQDYVQWRGVLNEAKNRFQEATSDLYRAKYKKLMIEQVCPECLGERLRPYPRVALFNGKRVGEVTAMTALDAARFFFNVKLSEEDLIIASPLLKEINERLHFLIEVGLGYLSLDRRAPTLSGGEAQRVRLASQIGSRLVGITYILDEPSIGLHPRDNKKLIRSLERLSEIGNTVVVVEHDEETLLAADTVVDFGPKAGKYGGHIVFQGAPRELLLCQNSLTGAYLSGRETIPVPKKRRKLSKRKIQIEGATHHNLKNVSVDIPLGVFVAVTGVSGSGKSSLITDILYPALSNHLHGGEQSVGKHQKIQGLDAVDKVIAIDQSPIGRNPRSNPATYIKLFDEIRDLFSKLPESRARGYLPGRFSFNVKEGSCPECKGMGMQKIDMDFLEEEWVECPSCLNRRFDEETLSIFFKGKNIYDVLDMEVDTASDVFKDIPHISKKLDVLKQVGLGYLKLGQSSTTLSGGEAQRIKLAKELVRPSTGNTLYIFDEPTTGLHFEDIRHLLEVLHHFVERGNSVLVIEHNMDVVKTADYIIDLGPDGGEFGGEVIATGTPEKMTALDTPTGKALYETLSLSQKERIALYTKSRGKKQEGKKLDKILISEAEQNNLKKVTLNIPREAITVFTGPSGSGKSSLAFDTLYAEGQRRYIESLSPYARQFVKQMDKPKVGFIEGLSPAIAIEQKTHAGNPRSTVGTQTEIYDFLRILFARLGVPHAPETGKPIRSITKEAVLERLLELPLNTKVQILAEITMRKEELFKDVIVRLAQKGYTKIRLNGEYFDLDEEGLEDKYDRKKKNALFLVIDRLKITGNQRIRLLEAIDSASVLGKKKLVVALDDEDLFFNLSFSDPTTGKSYPEITPHSFAFNKSEGMCLECLGLGSTYGANFGSKKELFGLNTHQLINLFFGGERDLSPFLRLIEGLGIDLSTPLEDINEKQLNLLLLGDKSGRTTLKNGLTVRFIGLNAGLKKFGRSSRPEYREEIVPFLDEEVCSACNGERLNPLARNVLLDGVSIGKLTGFPVRKALNFIEQVKVPKHERVLEEVVDEIISRLRFIDEVGLHYISLDRTARTLSGGETQRIRLARQLGSGITGALYVLDEPTCGLHPRDTNQLNKALQKIKALGNTLVIVEHDEETIREADYVVDFGPGSGHAGGFVMASGTFEEILQNENSLTGAYLSGKKSILIPEKRRASKKGFLEVKNAKIHNLKGINVSFPIGCLSCITGVSGSGKSTLLEDVIHTAFKNSQEGQTHIKLDGAEVQNLDQFDRMISIDQNPIGLTNRSDVATYVEVLTPIREFYAGLKEASLRGLLPRHFSYNHLKGMCTGCFGLGYKKVEMHFLPSVKITCEDCKGLRLNPVSLEVRYKGKNLGELLLSSIDEMRDFFSEHPKITKILDTLISVGLGYLTLGQEMATLSGGEAQRIKLSRELAKRSRGKTLYLLDEPTTGLHPEDIVKLLKVLNALVDKGNTVIMIEHQLDMIKNADFVVDLGPEAGDEGGYIIASGTPEEILRSKKSWTAKFLR